jgi:hypothetical protein
MEIKEFLHKKVLANLELWSLKAPVLMHHITKTLRTHVDTASSIPYLDM